MPSECPPLTLKCPLGEPPIQTSHIKGVYTDREIIEKKLQEKNSNSESKNQRPGPVYMSGSNAAFKIYAPPFNDYLICTSIQTM